jgi:ERF superfamily
MEEFTQGLPEGSQVTWKFSEQQGELVAALAAAQLEFQTIKKDKKNPHTGSMYADLNNIVVATQKALAQNKLVVQQLPVVEEKFAGVVSRLTHASNQFTEVKLLLPATMPKKKKRDPYGEVVEEGDGSSKFDAQSVGSAITYARRYTYGPQVGAVAEDDDDGNSAAGRDYENRSQQSSQSEQPRKSSPKPAPKVNSEPAQTGGRRPNEPRNEPKSTPANPVNTPQNAQGSTQTNEKAADAPSIVPKATIPADPIPPVSETKPAESTTSPESGTGQNSGQSNKPDKSQFDAYTARAIALKQPLEKVGLKAGPGVTTGTKLKKYILAQAGVSELTDLTVGQWEAVLGILEPLVKTNPSSVVTEIDGGK